MFGRKKRVHSNPSFANGPKASSSAQAAAALAFLNPQASNTSLSAAAAAAALRARPTTPTSVADVQTKRTMRRTNSNSSVGSSVSGSGRGPPGSQLERRGSSGSMTDRTFREPSPNRGSTRPSIDDAPPVPAIPKNLPTAAATNAHRRASSMETPVLPRIASPLPHPATGRGTSLEPYRGTQAPRRPAQRLSSLSSVQELTGVERPPSRGSVNFSYPIGLREKAPYGQRRLTSPTFSSASHSIVSGRKQNLVYDPNTRSFLPETQLLFIEQQVRDAAERPARRNKKTTTTQAVTGTYLSDGTVGGRMHGTAMNATNTAGSAVKQAGDSQTSTQSTRKTTARAKTKESTTSDIRREEESQTLSVSDYDSDNSEKPVKFNTRAGALLVKKPSIVREEREREEAEDESAKVLERDAALKRLESKSPDPRPVSPTELSKSNTPVGRGRGSASTPTTNGHDQQHSRFESSPVPTFSTETTAMSTTEPTSVDPREGKAKSVKPSRVQSISPVRTAHFLKTPESLAVKHQPPARSISPRKSALKHSPSRGSSPNGELPAGSSANRVSSLSDNSDTSTAISEERVLPRKKSVRVSFDDESNVVLGRADTPVTSDTPVLQSPQNKRGWLGSLGRGKKTDLSEMNDDDDEVMKPRPALPSFGSIREKKTRDSEERPLVRPTDFADHAPTASSTYTTATGEAFQPSLGQSQDHALGPLLVHDQISKNAANISKSREPLPPEVTSVEGSGYISDSESSVGTTEHTVQEPENIPEESKIEEKPKVDEELEHSQGGHSESSFPSSSTPGRDEPETSLPKVNGNGTIPSLALTQASPVIDDPGKDGEWPYIIGGFPSSSDSGLDDSQVSIVEHHPTELSPSAVGIAEPEPIVRPSGSPIVGEIAAQNILHHPINMEEDAEDSDDSIYSDAAEDLSDMQGDGFMSLDAVVDSPIVPNIPGRVISTPPDSPTVRGLREKQYLKSDSPVEPETPVPAKIESWDRTQEYWSGLTSEKRREMEKAAREDSDESSGEDEKPPPKPKTAKKVVVKPPTTVVSPQSSPRKKDYHSERTYQITPGAKAGPHGPAPAMRSSMRASSPRNEAAVHMRSSMRTPPPTEDQTHMRRSMRDGGSLRGAAPGTGLPPSQSKASLQKKYRPMSIPQPEIRPDPVEVSKHVGSISAGNTTTTAPTTKPTPTLRRRGSADSDSSFKRARPATQGYSMRSSMRGPQSRQAPPSPQSPELPPSTMRSGRFSLRSLSPTGSASHVAPSTGLGRTLRNNRGFSADSSGPTLRSQVPETSKSTSRFPGFGKPKPQPKAKAVPTRASRFADSSDEEDEVRPSFRSRFVNSSDEEDDVAPQPTTDRMPMTLRSTTRPTNIPDDDSDLSDSDNERPVQASKSTNVVVPVRAATPSHAGNALTSGSLRRSGSGRDFIGATTTTSITAGVVARPKQNRRGSFMSILRRKKPDPASKIQKVDGESGARLDTPLERTRADLRAVRQDSNFSTASTSGTPKLQKRGAPKRTGTSGTLENWPLASPHPEVSYAGANDERPRSSDRPEVDEKPLENGTGTALSEKPDLGPRRTTTTGLAAIDLSTVLPLKKKKKFGMLRRAFRLDD